MDEEIFVTKMMEEVQSTPHFYLADACGRGDIHEARCLIESGVSFRDGGCWLLVFQGAIENENTDVIELLIENGVHLSSFDAFTEAIKAADHPHMLEYLVLHGADPIRPEDGWYALQYAARYGRRLVLEWLIEDNQLDPGSGHHEGKTLLMLAALSRESGECVSPALEYLLSLNRIDVNARDINGHTALMRAAQCGLIRNTETLLRHGSLTGIRDYEGRTALMLASAGAPPDEIMCRNSKTADCPSRLVERELLDVHEAHYPAIVRLLLSFDAQPELHDAQANRAIDFAHGRGAEDIVSILWGGTER